MKYKFVKKGRKPNPSEIKASMNFDKMVSNSSSFVGANLSSSLLKSFSTFKIAAISMVSVAVLTTVTLFTFPEFFGLKNDSPNAELEQFNKVLEDSVSKAGANIITEEISIPVKKAMPKELETKSYTSDANEDQPNLLNEDVILQASPLPSRDAFFQYIYEHLKYPKEHLADSVEGFVNVRFKVNKKGETEDFKISKSLGEAFDNEVVRVIESYDQWLPATYNGEAQESFLSLRVTFKIANQ